MLRFISCNALELQRGIACFGHLPIWFHVYVMVVWYGSIFFCDWSNVYVFKGTPYYEMIEDLDFILESHLPFSFFAGWKSALGDRAEAIENFMWIEECCARLKKRDFLFFFGYSTFYHSTLESKNFRLGIGTAFNVNENCGII